MQKFIVFRPMRRMQEKELTISHAPIRHYSTGGRTACGKECPEGSSIVPLPHSEASNGLPRPGAAGMLHVELPHYLPAADSFVRIATSIR
jgi:hypothetical protein